MKYAVRYIKNTFYPLKVPDDLNLQEGQMVVVRTEKGEEALKVFIVNSQIEQIWAKSEVKPEPLPILKIMNQRDLQTLDEIKKEEVTAFFKCQALVKQHNLVMNLVQCRITFDRRKITFYYTAPERVDFRALLKDLTQTFPRVRIDLRHIGVRDETSILDGVGICGQPFCCSGFLKKFANINIKLAKDQGMPIAPGKISGTCGRLLCCLTYEYSNYIEAAKGKVCYLQFLSGKVAVKMEDGKTKEFDKNDIEMVDAEVNVEIDTNATSINNYDTGDDQNIDIHQLEDDKNSSTGNI